MILYCVRHGETLSNLAGRIQGQSDSPLSPLGWKQCQAAAAALAGRNAGAIYCSPLRRALDSAHCIGESLRLSICIDERLMEINAGIFQGLAWEEIERIHPEQSRLWKSNDPDFRITGGESRRDLMRRAREAFLSIRESGLQEVIVVAHGGLLAAAFKALLDVPAERNPFSLNNGSISKLAWDREVKLLTLNQTHHLPGNSENGGEL